MLVYHGTSLSNAFNIQENGVVLNKSNDFLDFGKGFYVTPDYEMAKNMACRVSKRTPRDKNGLPTVVCFEYMEDTRMNYRKFESEDIEWAKFIMANRVTDEIAREIGLFDNNRDFRYDIIIGGTADGNVASIASALRYGNKTPKEYRLELGDFLKEEGTSYGTQIAFCTEKSLSCIRYINFDIIEYRK